MRHYELMIILDPDLEERTVTPSLETYLKIIKESGGVVNKLDVWGKRRMSFEINKKAEGIYAVADMNCEPAAIKELDRQLNLNESLLRTKVMRPL
jgi:small subunit ribosomal protein S6